MLRARGALVGIRYGNRSLLETGSAARGLASCLRVGGQLPESSEALQRGPPGSACGLRASAAYCSEGSRGGLHRLALNGKGQGSRGGEWTHFAARALSTNAPAPVSNEDEDKATLATPGSSTPAAVTSAASSASAQAPTGLPTGTLSKNAVVAGLSETLSDKVSWYPVAEPLGRLGVCAAVSVSATLPKRCRERCFCHSSTHQHIYDHQEK